MKLIIAGSRTVTNVQIVAHALRKFNFKPNMVDEIVSGTARGVDQLGENIAKQRCIKVKRFPADWDKYGKSAGYRRNAEMAEYADQLLAVWDGESKGTKHMIDLMRKQYKPVYVYRV